MLVDVMRLIGRGENFGFIDVVDAKLFQNLRFDKMADAAFGHNRDGHGFHDFADHFRRGHAGDAALGADLGGNAFERHDGDGASLFGNLRLFDGDDVHDDAAFKHFGKANFEAGAGISVVERHEQPLSWIVKSGLWLRLPGQAGSRERRPKFPTSHSTATGRMAVPPCVGRGHSRSGLRFAKHALDVDGDKERVSARENFALGIQNLSAIGVFAAFNTDGVAFRAQRLVQGDGPQVVNLHGAGEGDHVVDFVDLTHHLIQDGGDNASVNVAWRAHKTLVEAKTADIAVARLVVAEAELHPRIVILAADEAAFFLQPDHAGAVAGRRLFGHEAF